jgi:hypothetical protein
MNISIAIFLGVTAILVFLLAHNLKLSRRTQNAIGITTSIVAMLAAIAVFVLPPTSSNDAAVPPNNTRLNRE